MKKAKNILGKFLRSRFVYDVKNLAVWGREIVIGAVVCNVAFFGAVGFGYMMIEWVQVVFK